MTWIQPFVNSIVRTLLTTLFGFLVAKKVLTEDLAGTIFDGTLAWLVMVICAVVPVAWSWVEKRFTSNVIAAAHFSSPSSSMDEVIDAAKKM